MLMVYNLIISIQCAMLKFQSMKFGLSWLKSGKMIARVTQSLGARLGIFAQL